MRTFICSLALALAALWVSAATAGATVTPDPYTTTTGSGTLAVNAMGPGSCSLRPVAAQLGSTAGGATGSLTRFTGTGCTGYLTAIQYISPISFTVNRGAVSVGFALLIDNILGGRCEYSGTLRGTAAARATTFNVSGTLSLSRAITGFCESSPSASLQLSLPGQSITWPSTGLTPDPYSTAVGTGILGLHTVYGSAGCQLGSAAISATGTSTGANGTITGFTASNCYGAYTRTAFNSNVTFSAASGVVSTSLNVLLTNVFGGTCLYGGTLTGTVPNGGYVLTARGTLTLTRTLGGYCEPSETATLGVALPGATISW